MTVSNFQILIKSCPIESRNDPTVLSRHVMTVSDFEILIKSCPIESRNDPTVLSRHVITVSDFEILIKSCSIESRNDPGPSLKISYSTHACLAQLDQHQTCKPVMVSVVSSNPAGGNYIF